MSRLASVVCRADLLRLLAAAPDAPLVAAAKIAGYQPQTKQPEELEDYETEPAAMRVCPQERFWHLHSRELLHSRPSLAYQPDTQPLLPAELWYVRLLREKELRCADHAYASSPHLRTSPPLVPLLHAALHLRPLSLPPHYASERKLEPIPAAAQFAAKMLRTGQPLNRTQVEWVDQFILRLVRTWFDRRKDADLLACAMEILNLLPASFRSQHDSAALLYGIVHRQALRHGAVIPPNYRPEAVLTVVQERQPSSTWLLIQEGEELFLINSPESGICLLKGSCIAGLTLDSDIILLRQNGNTATAAVQTMLPLLCLRGLEQIVVQSRIEKLVVQTCVRPSWATLIGRNSQELFAEVAWLGRGWRLRWQVPSSGSSGGWSSSHGPIRADHFGLSAHIGFYGRVMQRFRWIEPGSFVMGSPAHEPEREAWGKETQHDVRLSKGLWLAETSVSQELWQFVMRNNPARFLGRELPVESVSWEDVQVFLQRLNAMVPGLAARLPTEAEWEYACRAGTTTPFAFGNQISPEQVNYNGSCPYQGGCKALFRRQTVPVGSLPANAWGLHEMHGNLWEWCHDWWQEDLGYDAALNPQGLEQGEFRVVRGGSWFLSGRGVRSAVRGRFAPDFRNDRLGFRIARDHESTVEHITATVPPAAPESLPSFLRRFFGHG